jgi:hypothetical protein
VDSPELVLESTRSCGHQRVSGFSQPSPVHATLSSRNWVEWTWSQVDEEHDGWIRTVHHENVVWSVPPFTIHVDLSEPEPSEKVGIALLCISTSLETLSHMSTICSLDYEASHRASRLYTALTFHCMLPVPSSPMFVHCTESGWYTSQALPMHCSWADTSQQRLLVSLSPRLLASTIPRSRLGYRNNAAGSEKARTVAKNVHSRIGAPRLALVSRPACRVIDLMLARGTLAPDMMTRVCRRLHKFECGLTQADAR